MGYIHINRFQGIAPRIAPRKLGLNQAQIARNVNIFSHELKALQNNIQVFTPSKSGTIQSIYPLGAYWMHWTTDVDVIRTPQDLAESYGDRVHYTGDYNPKSTDDTLVHASPGTAYPTDYYRLGVPRPDTAPTVGHTGGSGTAVDRAYAYTFITAWGEEGPPSPVGTHTGVDDASSWNLTAIDATPPNSGNISAVTVNATTVDITFDTSHFLEETEYVTLGGTIVATGDLATDLVGTFQVTERLAVDEIRITLTTNGAYTSGGTWEREAPLQTTGWTKYIYRSLNGTYKYVGSTTGTTFNDTVADADLGEDLPGDVIEGDWYKAPHGDMQGIIALANGVCAGFYGKVLALTPEYIPSAWPTNYRVKFDFDVVAIAVLGNTVVVATTGQPYLVIVDDPSAAVSSKLGFFQPCIAKRSMKGLQNGVCYVCPDGVAYVPSAGVPRVITKPLAKKKDWDLFNPSSMLAEVYDDRYYLFYSDGGSDGDEDGGLIFDPEEPEATFTQLSGLITAAHKVIETDTLYLLDADQGTISKYDSGGAFQTYQWLSKQFTMALPTCLKAALVRFTMESALASADPAASAAAIAAAISSTDDTLSETGLTESTTGNMILLLSADAPVAWYRHEAGNLEVDSSGNGNDATTTTDVTEVAARTPPSGGAGEYDGSTSLQKVPNDSTIQGLHYVNINSGKHFSVVALVYLSSSWSGLGYILSKTATSDAGPDSYNSSSAAGGWAVGVSANRELYVFVPNTSSQRLKAKSTTILSLDTWYLVQINAHGSNASAVQFIINGAVDTTIVTYVGGIGIFSDSSNDLKIGHGNNGSSDTYLMEAKLDEVALFDYRLPASRCLRYALALGMSAPDAYTGAVLDDNPVAYYRHEGDYINLGVTDDWSENNNTASVTGTLNDASGVIGLCGNYTASPHMTAPNVAGVNQDLMLDAGSIISVEFIVNITSLGGYDFIAKGLPGSDLGWEIGIISSGEIYVSSRWSTAASTFYSTSTLSTGTWYHVVVVMQTDATSVSGVRKMYINNVAETINHTSDPSGTNASDASYPLVIAARRNAGDTAYERQLNAKLDELALYSGELSASRVAAHFAETGL